jgi:hypothetical protein
MSCNPTNRKKEKGIGNDRFTKKEFYGEALGAQIIIRLDYW